MDYIFYTVIGRLRSHDPSASLRIRTLLRRDSYFNIHITTTKYHEVRLMYALFC